MEASSGLSLPAENIRSVLYAERAPRVESPNVEDEEFPPDLPANYDWMLQPASRCASRRIWTLVAVSVAVALIAISVFVLHNLSHSFPKVLASPPTSSR